MKRRAGDFEAGARGKSANIAAAGASGGAQVGRTDPKNF
jgi:hypothetical protein